MKNKIIVQLSKNVIYSALVTRADKSASFSPRFDILTEEYSK